MKVMYCDPPSGWKYGFPKPLPMEHSIEGFDLNNWLIMNGYPKEEIEAYGTHFCLRFFEGEFNE